MARESKKGFGSTRLMGRGELRHTCSYGRWFYSEPQGQHVRLCIECGEFQVWVEVNPDTPTPRSPNRKPRRPRVHE